MKTAIKRFKRQQNQNEKKQRSLTNIQTKKPSFNNDLCKVLIASNIPLNKFSNYAFRQILETYTKTSIPRESFRGNYTSTTYITIQ